MDSTKLGGTIICWVKQNLNLGQLFLVTTISTKVNAKLPKFRAIII